MTAFAWSRDLLRIRLNDFAGKVRASTVSVTVIWLQRVGLAVVFILLALLAREAATRSIDFPVYHRAARQVIAGHYEFYPVEAYGGTPGPSQGFRYVPAIAFLFVPVGWLPLELAALAFFALKLAAAWYVGATVGRHAGLSGKGDGKCSSSHS